MKQTVNWESFEKAVQTQTDAIKVRRELEETPISEIHVMGGGLYGIANDEKTKTFARQQRQINGYVLRSFISNGGPIILPPKHGEGLLMTPMNMGQRQYGGYNSIVGNYVSSFTEPLQAPLDNNTMLLAKAGIAMASNSATNPYARLQFNMNMHLTQAEINKNQAQFIEERQYNVQRDIAKDLRTEQDLQFSGKKRKELMAELGQRARTEAAPQNPIAVAQKRGRGANVLQQNEVAAALVAANQSESESSASSSASTKGRRYRQKAMEDYQAAKASNNPLANVYAPFSPVSQGSASSNEYSSAAESLSGQLFSSGEEYEDPPGYHTLGYDASFNASMSLGEEKADEPGGTFDFPAALAKQRDQRAAAAQQQTTVERNLEIQLSDGSKNAQSLTNSTEKQIVNKAKLSQSIDQKTASDSLFARGANAINQLFSPSASGIKEQATPQGMYIAPVLGSHEKYNPNRRTSLIHGNPVVPLSRTDEGFVTVGKQGRPVVSKGNNTFFRSRKIEPDYQFQEGGGSVGEFSNVQGSFTATPPMKGSKSAANIYPARRGAPGTA
jgi:hypothetical protein